MKTKNLSVLFLTSMVLCGCQGNANQGNTDFDVHPGPSMATGVSYKIKNSYDSTATYTKESTFSFNMSDFVSKDSTVYDPTIAKLAVLLAGDAYEWWNIQFYSPIKGDYIEGSLMERISLEDIKEFDLKSIGVVGDKNDVSTAYIGHQLYYDESDKAHQIVVVNFKGTSSDAEWISNFDIGADTTSYANITGEHKYWTNKKHHKGFDVTLNRHIENFKKYEEEFLKNDVDTVYLVTGHSRGAALANMYGAYLTDKNIKNFTYTFAAPGVVETSDVLTEKYGSIFNIVNGNDLIAAVPPRDTGFKRYGKDKIYKVSDLSDLYQELTEDRTYTSMDIKPLEDIIVDILKNRVALYEINEEPLEEDRGSEATLEAAQKAINKIKNAARNCGVYNMIVFNEPTLNSETGLYDYSWRMAPAILLSALNCVMERGVLNAMANYGQLCPTYMSLLSEKASSISGDVKGIEEAHMPEAYITLVNYFNNN